MARTPLVSVIVPCHAQASYLPRAVESVLAQTLADWELVVIDDGSPDDVPGALAPGLQDPRVTLVQQSNRGLGGARNRGIAATTGPYVQFLDADDWLAPEKLERQLAVFGDEPDVGLVYCDYHIAFEETGRLERVDAHELGSLESKPLETFWIRWNFPPHVPLVRRAWLERVGGFSEDVMFAEDVDLWLRLMAADCRWRHVPEPLAYYRRHCASMTAVRSPERLASDYDVLRERFLRRHAEAGTQASAAGVARIRARLDDLERTRLDLQADLKVAKRRIAVEEQMLAARWTQHLRRQGRDAD